MLTIVSILLTSVYAIGQSATGQSSNQTKKAISVAIEVLEGKGIAGFAEVLGASVDGLPAIEFDTCDETEVELAQALFAASERPFAPGAAEISDFKALLRAEQWFLKAEGVRNLVLAYAVEEKAWRLLAYRLKSEPSDFVAITNDIAILRMASPGLAYWASAARRIWPNAVLSEEAGQPEYMAFAKLLDGIEKSEAKIEISNIVWAKRTGFGFRAHFAAPDSGVVFLMAMRSVVWGIALDAVSEIAMKTGTIPDNRQEFIESAVKFASPILNKRDRLGGWMTAGHAWMLWDELTK